MSRDFVYQGTPSRVVFRVGALETLADEVARLGAARALILCTPGKRAWADDVAARLGARAAGIFDQARMHTPIETAEAARAAARDRRADCTVAIGGGSTISLAKAVALATDLPILAVPTTYSGAEMTTIWGLTEGGAKTTGRDPRAMARTVIYDPALTLGLPPAVAGPSGLNALAHCVEALYAPDGNPIVDLLAADGARALAASLPAVVAHPDDIDARSEALYGAWLAGAALGSVAMALHHKLCHVLGGSFGLPHAEVHTVILPQAAAYNCAAASAAMARLARALGVADAADVPAAIYDLAGAVEAKRALRDIGMKESDLDRAAELASADPYANPRPVTRDGIRALLDDAFFGRRPGGEHQLLRERTA